jgi:transposase
MRGGRQCAWSVISIYTEGLDGEKKIADYFSDQRSYQGDAHGYMKHVFVDNCSLHNGLERVTQVLSSKNTKLCYLPPCTTHLCQPADTFVISKIKDAWRSQWEKKKLEWIQRRMWQNDNRTDGV